MKKLKIFLFVGIGLFFVFINFTNASNVSVGETDGGGGGDFKCSDSGWYYAGKTDAGNPSCCPNGYSFNKSEQLCYTNNYSGRSCPNGVPYNDIYSPYGPCRISAKKATSTANDFVVYLDKQGGTIAGQTGTGVTPFNCSAAFCSISGLIPKKAGCDKFLGWYSEKKNKYLVVVTADNAGETLKAKYDGCTSGQGSGSGSGSTPTEVPKWAQFKPNGGLWSKISSSSWLDLKSVDGLATVTYNGNFYFTNLPSINKNNDNNCTTSYVFNGWYSQIQNKNLYYYISSENNGDHLTAQWSCKKTVQSQPPASAPPVDPTNPETAKPTSNPDVVDAITINYYTVTYNLGASDATFIDGSTTRTEIVKETDSVGNLDTNPIRDGYRFVNWTLNDKEFDFTSKLTSNITLVATWEKVEDITSACEDGWILEYTANKCYQVLTANDKPRFTTLIYTTSKNPNGVRYCWIPEGTTKSGAVHYTAGASYDVDQNGKTDISKTAKELYGYDNQETWLAENTCQIASPCGTVNDSGTTISEEVNNNYKNSECRMTWKAIVYNEKEALPVPKDEDKEDKTLEEASGNGQTGDALIIVAWVAVILAGGYTVYYFRQKKKETV